MAGYAQLSFVIYAIFGWICAIGVRWKYTPYGVYLGVVRNAWEATGNHEKVHVRRKRRKNLPVLDARRPWLAKIERKGVLLE